MLELAEPGSPSAQPFAFHKNPDSDKVEQGRWQRSAVPFKQT